jgi:hypothetical protein
MLRKLAIVFLIAPVRFRSQPFTRATVVFLSPQRDVCRKARIFPWYVYEKEPDLVDQGTPIYRLHAALQLQFKSVRVNP